MRRIILAGLALLATGAADAPTMPGWLAGCWSEQKGSSWTEECWTAPRAGNMLGSGRNGRNDLLRSWETMQIEQASDGTLTFYGAPRGGARVAFPMVSSGPREIVFANPQHDYPQRIRYWREGMDLNAETSLADGSKAFRWRYKRLGGS
jgi:hypothetical protein